MIRKTLLINLMITGSIYSFAYLVRVFVTWSFPNPFDWIIRLPTYENASRGGILFAWLLYEGILIGIVYSELKDKAKKKKEAAQ